MTVVRKLHEPPSRGAIRAAEETFRRVLGALAGRERLSNEELEAVFERVDVELRALPKGSWVWGALDRVVGRSVKRKRDAIFVLVTLASTPGGDARLARYVNDKSAAVRLEAIAAIHRQRWAQLAPALAERLGVETDAACRSALIVACGDLRAPATLEALLAVAARDMKRLKKASEDRHRILFHLRRHASERARAYFQAVFDALRSEAKPPFDGAAEQQVLAAWGLLALGAAPEAHTFLVGMLDDTRIVHVREGKVSAVEPGLSERAAQALADIHHLPFRWGKGDAPKVRAHVRRLR